MTARLGAVVDGQPLAEAEARALWERFSAHMDEHQGDLAGFAAKEGFASVRPESRAGQAVLVLSRSAAQIPYGKPEGRSGGGSKGDQGRAPTQGGGAARPGGQGGPRGQKRRGR